jgi:uncharacterized membrane protein YvbJ
MDPETFPNLISCPDRGNLTSRLAATCPKCGRPIGDTSNQVQRDGKQMNSLQTLNAHPIAVVLVLLSLCAIGFVIYVFLVAATQ